MKHISYIRAKKVRVIQFYRLKLPAIIIFIAIFGTAKFYSQLNIMSFGVIPYSMFSRSSGIYFSKHYGNSEVAHRFSEQRLLYSYELNQNGFKTDFNSVGNTINDNTIFRGLTFQNVVSQRKEDGGAIGFVLSARYWRYKNRWADADDYVPGATNSWKELRDAKMFALLAGIECAANSDLRKLDLELSLNFGVGLGWMKYKIYSLENYPTTVYQPALPFNTSRQHILLSMGAAVKFGFKREKVPESK